SRPRSSGSRPRLRGRVRSMGTRDSPADRARGAGLLGAVTHEPARSKAMAGARQVRPRDPVAARRWGIGWLLLSALALSGCGSLPSLESRTPSHALTDTAS